MTHEYPADQILGILSDSHGRAGVTRKAVDLLIDAGAQTLIHLGDICELPVLDALAGFDAHVVFGNCDWDVDAMSDYATPLGISVDHPVGRLRVGGRSVVFAHGDVAAHEQGAIADGADYFLHGHTHQTRDEHLGSTRILNPGALFRASRYTVACLEPGRDQVRFLAVERP